MHSKIKGNIGELALAKFLAEKEYSVFAELGDISRIDLIAEKDGKLIRFQCKSALPKDGKVSLQLRKMGPGYCYKYKDTDFDYLSLYDLHNHELYLFPSNILNVNVSNFTLRLDPPKNNQYTNIHDPTKYKAENVFLINMGL